jgi:hypothetical protein
LIDDHPGHKQDTAFYAAIITCWYAFDKWYAATDTTPAYAAAVLLHPGRRTAYLKNYWPKKWSGPAIRAAKAY